jgi:pseudouridine-5'-phosphate glycosidase
VPAEAALPDAVAREALVRATREAAESGVHGWELTPWLLGRIAILTDGASVRANVALIVNNAGFAGRLASALGRRWR